MFAEVEVGEAGAPSAGSFPFSIPPHVMRKMDCVKFSHSLISPNSKTEVSPKILRSKSYKYMS